MMSHGERELLLLLARVTANLAARGPFFTVASSANECGVLMGPLEIQRAIERIEGGVKREAEDAARSAVAAAAAVRALLE